MSELRLKIVVMSAIVFIIQDLTRVMCNFTTSQLPVVAVAMSFTVAMRARFC